MKVKEMILPISKSRLVSGKKIQLLENKIAIETVFVKAAMATKDMILL
jgi:hypothetical protein